MFAVGMAADAGMKAAVDRHLAKVTDALDPYDAGRQYLNFAERSIDPARLFSPESYRRLQTVKARHDPCVVFKANHPIPPVR